MNTQKNPNDPATDSKDEENFSTEGNMQKGWFVIAGFVVAMIVIVAMQVLRG